MEYCIEFNYISPLTQLTFYPNNIYTLVISHSDLSNTYIHKFVIKNLNNINNITRGYIINRGIKVKPSPFGNIINIRLYCYTRAYNIIKLLAYTDISLEKYEIGNKSIIRMNIPSNINDYRTTKYNNDMIYLREYFHNIENNDEDSGYCLLFFRLITDNNTISFTNPTIINHLKDIYNYKFMYNRYINNISIQYNGNKYNDNVINIDYRPLNIDKYINSILIGPCDGRYKGVIIKKNQNQTQNQNILNTNTYFDDKQLQGYGYVINLLPIDYKSIFIPYAGYLVNLISNDKYIVLTIESDYYIAPHIHERSYLSVMNGKSTYQGSGVGATDDMYSPELLKIQENSKLIYNLTIIFTSNNTIDYKYLKIGQWMEQGKEILNRSDIEQVLFVINRKIDYVNDIKKYNENNLETFIRARDIIGILN
jgi:hypothetical protein